MKKSVMVRGVMVVLLTGCMVAGFSYAVMAAQVTPEIKQAVEDFLVKKTKFSGTLDLLDENLEKARNLRKIEMNEEMTEDNGQYEVFVDYRDINTGAVVTVGFMCEKVGGAIEINDLEIVKVEELRQVQDVKKDFTDEDIQKAMKDYLDLQAKFTGTISLYDEKNSKLRQLELISLDPLVRHLGKFHISGAEFKDVESGQILNIDITAEDNKKGGLEIQSMRIRKVTTP